MYNFTEEQEQLRKTIINFSRQELNPGLEERERRGQFSHDLWRKCASINLLALPFEEKHGGCGLNFIDTIIAFESLSYGCKDSGLVHSLGTCLISGLMIKLFGNEEQKARYLPEICRGQIIAAQAITEPDAGSDIMSIGTRAIKTGSSYKLEGRKTFISNGPVADIFLVLAITNPERKGFGTHSFLLCEKNRPGLSISLPIEKMGLRTLQNSDVIFEGCLLPEQNLIGREGQGTIIFNEIMEWERILFAACHLGTLTRIIETCIKYANERKQYGQQIGKFQSISNKIVRMKICQELIRTYLYQMALAKDQKRMVALQASILKIFTSESLKQACADAIQIHGAYGFMTEFEIERDLRDSMASTIYSGTTEINMKIIARMLKL
ncbi:MAG: acyl-CoA dehydrogenase [Candidatus Aminicenantes bacterium]|nr:acyl-CoA dehydrogenase [Candidatus Aminicenantes bacterium]